MPRLLTVGETRGLGLPKSVGGATFSATGGTTTDSGGYRYHTFNSSGTFAVSAGTATGEVLAVAVAVAVDISHRQSVSAAVAVALAITHLVRHSLLSQATTRSL